jgi:hypothetical protein
MLRFKYYQNFKGSESLVLVMGDRDDYIAVGEVRNMMFFHE